MVYKQFRCHTTWSYIMFNKIRIEHWKIYEIRFTTIIHANRIISNLYGNTSSRFPGVLQSNMRKQIYKAKSTPPHSLMNISSDWHSPFSLSSYIKYWKERPYHFCPDFHMNIKLYFRFRKHNNRAQLHWFLSCFTLVYSILHLNHLSAIFWALVIHRKCIIHQGRFTTE